jgi:hypothetical protein
VTLPYSAAPLTAEQRNEVLRVMSDTTAASRHAYRLHLDAEIATAQRLVREQPDRAVEHRATAAAFERAVELMTHCWPATRAAIPRH